MNAEPPSPPLDFTRERDRNTTSWQRADPYRALIARLSLFGFKVLLPAGDDAHIVALARDEGGYLGQCDCDGYDYNPGPCAHLCTLRKADYMGDVCDTHGQPVRIADVTEGMGRPEAQL